MDISWDDARLFLAVAEGGSVSAAGRQLGIAQPTVSRRLRELEAALGFTLFARTTAGVALTTRGERLLEPARKMATWAAELSRAAEKHDAKPSGVVRVTAPPGVAADFLAPFAASLMMTQPGLRLQVLSSVDYLDLHRGQADLAIRMRPIEPHRDLVVVAQRQLGIAAWAAPSYAATVPSSPSLTDLRWIAWAPPFEQLPPSAQLAAAMPGFQPAFAADDFLVQLAAAEAGVGAIILGDLGHRFTRGRLVKLAVDLSAYGTSPIALVAARSALEIPRVRLVADLLTAELDASVASRPKRRSR